MRKKMEKLARLLLAALYIVFGLISCFYAEPLAHIFHYIIGVMVGLSGILGLFVYFTKKCYLDKENKDFIENVLNIVVAILIIAAPATSAIFICVVWGISSILKSILELNHLIQEKLLGRRILWKSVFCCIELGLGIVLLLELTNAVGHHILLLGISMVSIGLRNFFAYDKEIDEVNWEA